MTTTRPQAHWFPLLFGELTVTNIGLFAVLAVLTLHLVEALHFTHTQTALALAASTIGMRFMRLALAPVIDRVPPQRAIPAAILLSLAGYLLLANAVTLPWVMLGLLMVGTGYGANGMLVTTLASYAPERYGNGLSRYVWMNMGTNFAAIVGPLLANALRLEVSVQAPFYLSAAMLVLSFCISLRLPGALPVIRTERHWFHAAGELLRHPPYLRAFCAVALGWAVYAQKFSSIPLLVNGLNPAWVGPLVAANALLILALSVPFARWAAKHAWTREAIIVTALALYALAYGILWLFPAAVWGAMLLWSSAEGMLMPALNSAIAASTGERHRFTGFSLAAGAFGIGEVTGYISGATMFRMLGGQCFLWFSLAAVFAALVVHWLHLPNKKTLEAPCET